MDEGLFEEVEAWAGKLGISCNQFFARAVEKYVRRYENEELLRRLNERPVPLLNFEVRFVGRTLPSTTTYTPGYTFGTKRGQKIWRTKRRRFR